MISYETALAHVISHPKDYGEETVSLQESCGRVLAEDLFADRDFPPFDRSTKDGIAISFDDYAAGQRRFPIEGVAAAGSPHLALEKAGQCLEVMTGAMLPKGCDTIIMYEQVDIANGIASIKENHTHQQGKNIHPQASDAPKGSLLLAKGKLISSAEIGVLATLGKSEVIVKKTPHIAVISTGNELVPIERTPLAHQIRSSNSSSLQSALNRLHISAEVLHLNDQPEQLRLRIAELLETKDILILSGGVSKGKFDFLPEVFEQLGVEKIFHRVKQRPGKPFWFGQHTASNTLIFSFPGNPNSTFINFHLYFLAWWRKSMGLNENRIFVQLAEAMPASASLCRFQQVRISYSDTGMLLANKVVSSGSGDLLRLTQSSGVLCLPPRAHDYEEGEVCAYIPFLKPYTG